MTVRHMVSFSWNDTVSPDHAERFAAALAQLPAAIPELVTYTFGADLGLVDGNADFAVVADFADAAGFEAYRDHPDHQQVIAEFIAGKVSSRSAAQFEI